MSDIYVKGWMSGYNVPQNTDIHYRSEVTGHHLQGGTALIIDKSSAVAEMGDRLVTVNMGRKVGGATVPLYVGKLGPHLTQCGLGRDLPR